MQEGNGGDFRSHQGSGRGPPPRGNLWHDGPPLSTGETPQPYEQRRDSCRTSTSSSDRGYPTERIRSGSKGGYRRGDGRRFRDARPPARERRHSEDNYYGPQHDGGRDDAYLRSDDNYYGPPRRIRTSSEEQNVELDEFGRLPRTKSDSPDPESRPPPKKVPEWPPSFENEGSSFVFDARSGMFYEGDSDFFYDPKTKLYYGNKKGAYFRWDETADPPFVEVEKTTTDPDALEATAVDGGLSGLNAKPMIAIKLKTKKMKKAKVNGDSKNPPPATKVQKQQAEDIEKWKERQAELKVSSVASQMAPSVTSSDKIRKTATGQPVCLVCKRKFASIDKLQLHERASELHKTNLAKLEESKKRKEGPSSAVEYHDRAQKRRDLHGPEAVPIVFKQEPMPLIKQEAEPAIPEDNLGAGNIGNQMLMKMGWSGTSSLGRRSREQGDTERNDSTEQNLRKDWERIEALASIKRERY